MKLLCSMREALDDPAVLGGVLDGSTWDAWRVVLIAARGEPLTSEEREIYRELTEREREPDTPCKELWAIVGRRGGKTRAISVLGSYMATCVDYEGRFVSGQRGRLPIVAAAKYQATEALRYMLGIFEESPTLSEMLDGEPTADTIRLKNRVDVWVTAANFRTVRSTTNVAAICDELALWRIENAANPDKEILRAIRPGGATTGAPLFVLSSPYAKKGELWDTYRRDFGPKGDPRVLVVRAPTLRMHDTPAVREEVELEFRRDPENAKAEYGAEFRDGVSDFVRHEDVEACTDLGVPHRPPESGISYQAFIDPSGGAKDSMTLAIAHRKKELGPILDLVLEVKPPLSPAAVCEQFASVLKTYRVTKVRGDNYAGEWPKEGMRKHGITYEKSADPRNEIYTKFLPILNSHGCRLLDHPEMRRQLLNLERRTAFGGRDTIGHPAADHDDVINAVAGAIVMQSERSFSLTWALYDGDDGYAP